MTKIMERFGLEEVRNLSTAGSINRWRQRRSVVEQRNYLIRTRTARFRTTRDEHCNAKWFTRIAMKWIDSEEPRKLIFEVIDEAVPGKVKEYLDVDEPNSPVWCIG